MASITNSGDRFRIGRVFNDSFAVIGRNLALCLGLGAAFHALPRFVAWLWYMDSAAAGLTGWAFVSQHAIAVVLGAAVYLVVTAVLQTSLIRATIVDLRGAKPTFSDCFGVAIILFLPVLGASLLVTLGIVIGLVLLIVPGILVLLRWAVTMPVLIQERRGILDSMARSRDLTAGSRWPMLGLWMILIVVSVSANLVISGVAIPLNITFGLLAEAVIRAALLVLSSVVMAVTYIELLRIKEGTGVEDLAEIFS